MAGGLVGEYLHVAREANFQAKASNQSRAGFGGSWIVVDAGERSIPGKPNAVGRYDDAPSQRKPRNRPP